MLKTEYENQEMISEGNGYKLKTTEKSIQAKNIVLLEYQQQAKKLETRLKKEQDTHTVIIFHRSIFRGRLCRTIIQLNTLRYLRYGFCL